MPFLAAFPILTALAAVVCALWPPAHRLIWPTVALAALNVVLTPLTSGEWIYQREEDPFYQQAVAKGDFKSFDDLLGRHDPQLVGRMTVIAISQLVSLVVLAVLCRRTAPGSRRGTAVSVAAKVAVVLAASATLVQSFVILT